MTTPRGNASCTNRRLRSLLAIAAAAGIVAATPFSARADEEASLDSIVAPADKLSTAEYVDKSLAEAGAAADPIRPVSYEEEAYLSSPVPTAGRRTPVNWIAGPYIEAGVPITIGTSLLEHEQRAGYSVAGGFRQALAPGLLGDHAFFDFGGSYLSAFGETIRNTAGRRTDAAGVVTITQNAYATTLKEVQRRSAHMALGWALGPAVDNRADDPQLRYLVRLGGRFGSVRGRFSDFQILAPPVGTTQTPFHDKSDIFGGLFVSADAILLRRQSTMGDVQLTVSGELANDWIDFGGFHGGTLGTGAILAGFTLCR